MDLASMEALAARLGDAPLPDFGDMAADTRVPLHIRQNIRLARELRELGLAGPKFGFGPFRQMYDGAIMLANQTAVTGTTEAAIWPVAQYSGFQANQLRSGQIWHLTAWGIMSTAGSSQGNITLTARCGTTAGGTQLAISTATALVASASSVPWRLEADFDVRKVGNAGANSVMVCNGWFLTTPAAIAASTGQPVLFGSTADVSVDLSIAGGFYIGTTMGSASDTMTAMGVRLESLN